MKGIADTGFLVAFANRGDRHHEWAVSVATRVREPGQRIHPRHSAITVDRGDFRIYRRNKRETIPLVCPPER